MMQSQNSYNNRMDTPSFKSILHELKANTDCVALMLFGSVAREEARAISDIDLCIITRKNTPEPEAMNLMSYGSEGIDISLFWDLPLMIKFRVIKEGKILFCKDPLLLHRIKTDTIREYLDTAPLIRKHSLHCIDVFPVMK